MDTLKQLEYKYCKDYRGYFEDLASLLFCMEYHQSHGVNRRKNQAGIEADPIDVDGERIAFQAKYYDESTSLNSRKDDLKKSVEEAARENVTKLIIYTNKELTQSSTKEKPAFEQEIDDLARDNNMIVEWQTGSSINTTLEMPEYEYIRKIYFGSENNKDGFVAFYQYAVKKVTAHEKDCIYGDIPLIEGYLEPYIKVDNKIHSFKSYLYNWVSDQGNKDKIIIVFGEPGHGKTSLCYKAMYDHYKEGWLSGLVQNVFHQLNLTTLQYIKELYNLLKEKEAKYCEKTIGNLSNLQYLDLDGTLISSLPESIGNLSSLQYLYLCYTNISSLTDNIGNLSSLKYLDLSHTNISSLPESIGSLLNLQDLDLRSTKISALPETIGDLSALRNLYLQGLTLVELPESLLKLNLEYRNKNYGYSDKSGIYIEDLKLLNQPIETFSQSRDVIIEYYKSSMSTSPINKCKVVFLGDGGAGKSLIIDRLMKDGKKSPKFKGDATPGIKITSKKYQIDGDEIELHFWDFGGQAIMHSMHRLFLTNRTLYVVVTNARDDKANEQAWYWIRNIKSFANGAPVFLLINQKDQNPSANINETGLRKEYPYIKGVKTVSALKDAMKEFNKCIRDEICRIVSEMKSVHTPFAKSWLSLMNDLNKMPKDYIDSAVFRSKCRDNGIDLKQETLDQIIGWYQDLGVCFNSKAHPTSSKYMVLKPRWLLNAIYILSFNGRKKANNGILFEGDIHKLIRKPVPDMVVKKVYPDIEYKEHETQYILNVLLNFNLVYRIDNVRFFVPMLCDENEPDIIDEFDTEDAIHVSFRYVYLPENVIHRLMVLRGDELNTEVVWKTGALFERKRCSWQALARIKDNCLDVYAKAGDQETHPIHSYLDIIRESVYKINSDLGLAADEFITYAKDGKKDEFKYKKLEGRKKAGQNEDYSEVFDALISIDEIIGAITSPNLLARGYEDGQMQALLTIE